MIIQLPNQIDIVSIAHAAHKAASSFLLHIYKVAYC